MEITPKCKVRAANRLKVTFTLFFCTIEIMKAADTEHKTVLFISPHLDDVALSCSKSVSALRRQGFDTMVVTLFSTSDNPTRIGNRPWEKVSYEERKREDLKACESLGAKALYMDFLDAPYRLQKFSKFNSLFLSSPKNYPQLIKDLAEKIRALIDKHRPLKIFAPLGIGWHIDHLLTFEAIYSLKTNPKFADVEFYFYEDRPYTFVPGALTLRFSELGLYPATENPRILATKFVLAVVHAYAWIFSRMGMAGQVNIFSMLWGFFRVLRRNLKLIQKRSNQVALKLQLDGSVDDLNFAHSVSKTYLSQFPYLFGDDEKFRNLSLQYAQALSPNATYSERMWII